MFLLLSSSSSFSSEAEHQRHGNDSHAKALHFFPRNILRKNSLFLVSCVKGTENVPYSRNKVSILLEDEETGRDCHVR